MSVFQNFMRFLTGANSRTPGPQDGAPVAGRLTTRTITTETAMQLSAVFACVRVLAETVAGLPLIFYRRDAKGIRVPDTQHPLFRLLSFKPNRYQSRIEFFETVIMQLALSGNAYIQIQRSGKAIIGLLPLMSGQVQTRLLTDGSVVYEYHNGVNVTVFAAESIWHIKLFGNGIVGLSPLDHARNSLGISINAEDRVSRLANSGFKPSGVLMLDKILTPTQRGQMRESFAHLVAGGDDTLQILEAGMKYQQVSLAPKDMQLLESRRFQIEDICRFFGVPSVLVNDTTATTAWGSGIEQIVQGFYKLTIRPYLERIESSLSVWLLPPDERWVVEAEFDFDALLRGDQKTRFTTYKEAIQSGVKTPNEVRKYEGDPPLEGGDVAYMQAQMVPLAILQNGPSKAAAPVPLNDIEEGTQK